MRRGGEAKGDRSLVSVSITFYQFGHMFDVLGHFCCQSHLALWGFGRVISGNIFLHVWGIKFAGQISYTPTPSYKSLAAWGLKLYAPSPLP